MSTDKHLPHTRRVIKLDNGITVEIEPNVGYYETRPVTGFIRTQLRDAPTRVNMARALMAHAMAVLDEVEGLTEAEFVAVCDAYVPLVKKMVALPARVAWTGPGGMAVRKPGD
jgi:hypothetical protein